MIALLVLGACAPPPTPAPLSSYATTFDSADHWTQTASRQADIFIQDGQLHIVVKEAERLAWSLAGLALDDVSIEVDATPVAGPLDNGFGLIARRVDDDNFYSFQISSDGYFLIQKRARGKWSNLTGDWQPSSAIRTGQKTNHLRVVCKGPLLTFIVNGTQVAQVTDGSFGRGDVGVVASTLAEAGVHVAFDNVQIDDLEEKQP